MSRVNHSCPRRCSAPPRGSSAPCVPRRGTGRVAGGLAPPQKVSRAHRAAHHLMVVSVSFWAFWSFRPTLCFTRRKSTPTPGFFRLMTFPMAARPRLLAYSAALVPLLPQDGLKQEVRGGNPQSPTCLLLPGQARGSPPSYFSRKRKAELASHAPRRAQRAPCVPGLVLAWGTCVRCSPAAGAARSRRGVLFGRGVLAPGRRSDGPRHAREAHQSQPAHGSHP